MGFLVFRGAVVSGGSGGVEITSTVRTAGDAAGELVCDSKGGLAADGSTVFSFSSR